MSVVLITVVVLLIAGIVFVSSRTPVHKSRNKFLRDLNDYVDGEIFKIEGMENSYRIKFKYHNIEFFFEDVEDVGFKGKVNRYLLKARLDNTFNLSFYEKTAIANLRADLIRQTGWQKLQASVLTTIDIPRVFYDLDIDTNNYNKAKNFFLDEKAKNILISFKNFDPRKHPFVSLRALKGVLILEFHSSLTFEPNILSLNHNVPSIDKYLDKMIVLIKAFHKDYA